MRSARFAVSMVLVAFAAGPLAADDLASLIPNLFDQRIVLRDPTVPGFPSHAAHFVDEQDRLRATGLLLNGSLVSQLASFPIGSSAGGFTYTYDESLGVFTRSSESFGPVFAERAQTVGRGKWNAGFSYQKASYDELDGLDLESGEIAFPLFHQDTNNDDTSTNLFFEGDVILSRSSFQIDSQTTVAFAAYGVTDRFDLSVAVPLVSVDLEASSVLTIDHLATVNNPDIHRFPSGSDQQSFAARGSASGVGDVVVRGKYRFWENSGSGLAAALDLRLPTGNEDDLLGTGATQAKLFFIASTSLGSFSPHANLGYTFSSGGPGDIEVPDELNYAAGFDWAVHPRLTFAVDAVGRILKDATAIAIQDRTVRFTTSNGGPVQTTTVPDLLGSRDDLNLLLGAAGVRWNPGGTFLVTLNALFSLSDDGLQDKGVVPFVGLDYSF